ncbi:competence protein ComEA [Thalassotalea insulae]|uniref:Competence protein ComEA n=1 Tax=Thalassotalea insulae TaxID=2056778 RepID=A0ABQ6GW53_9GAMM|nr:ComEA family DNA-binding protein [Thalassotalea insulae]GLX80168.1 competence protein ComEA [Thalassotalea insulae]
MKKVIFSAIVIAFSTLSFANHAFDNDSGKAVATSVVSDSVININQADTKALALLKGIGKKKAQAIVSYRQAHGDFSSIDDLLKVEGIGKKIIEQNKARLSI